MTTSRQGGLSTDVSASLVALRTIVAREVTRILRIWLQTLVPPAITMTLYFIIFGKLVGERIGNVVQDYSYMQFIVPGLVMMSVITNSYSNVASSFYSARFQKNVEEMLVAPVPPSVIILGYVCGGVFRGILVGVIVAVVSLLFTTFEIHSFAVLGSTILLAAFLFSLAGFTNAIFARRFDDISIIPTFVLTPLTYLGGVFYSINMIGEPWRAISLFNPILYIVNSFRYGFLGFSDIDVTYGFLIIVVFIILLFAANLMLMRRGHGITT